MCTPVAVPVGALYEAIAAVLGVPPPRRLPFQLIYGAGVLAEAWGALTGEPPLLNLEIARLARFCSGTRRIDKARKLLHFEPCHHDPLSAITELYAQRAARASGAA